MNPRSGDIRADIGQCGDDDTKSDDRSGISVNARDDIDADASPVIGYPTEADVDAWRTIDRRISPDELLRKIRDRRALLLRGAGRIVGVLRWSLFWDEVPFLNLIYLLQPYRGKGYGTLLLARWEENMRALGHPVVMTSTQADENAQHFYRKHGYRDAGCLLLTEPPVAQPAELFFVKALDKG